MWEKKKCESEGKNRREAEKEENLNELNRRQLLDQSGAATNKARLSKEKERDCDVPVRGVRWATRERRGAKCYALAVSPAVLK